MADLLFHSGTAATDTGLVEADVLVRGEQIADIGPGLRATGAERFDAGGMYVLPGGIDVHTHLDLDTGAARASDDWRTGTIAAACGGTTAVVDHPGFGPGGCSLFHQIDRYHELAAGSAAVDYSFHGVIQHVDDAVIRDLGRLMDRGITTCKAYLTYDYRLSDQDLLAVLERVRRLGGLTAVHCENHGMIEHLRRRFHEEGRREPWYHAMSRPPEAEAEAVARVIRLAEVAGNAPVYIVHLSTEAGLEEVRRGRERGAAVYAETCPQYLLLTEERYREEDLGGLKYIMSPPLRSTADTEALWEGLADGSIDAVGTDHCPFDLSLKRELGGDDFSRCPGGAAGIETRIPLVFSEGVLKRQLPVDRFVQVTAAAPARLTGLHPRKGSLAPGSDADIVVIDPAARVTLSQKMLHQNVDYTPFEGFEVTGVPVLTTLRGSVVSRRGEFVGAVGAGRFVKRDRPFPLR